MPYPLAQVTLIVSPNLTTTPLLGIVVACRIGLTRHTFSENKTMKS